MRLIFDRYINNTPVAEIEAIAKNLRAEFIRDSIALENKRSVLVDMESRILARRAASAGLELDCWYTIDFKDGPDLLSFAGVSRVSPWSMERPGLVFRPITMKGSVSKSSVVYGDWILAHCTAWAGTTADARKWKRAHAAKAEG